MAQSAKEKMAAPAMDESGARPTSTPPEAKVMAARTAHVVATIGAANDFFCTAAIAILIGLGRMDPEPWGYVMAGLAVGATVGRVRGGGGGSTAMVIGALAGKGVLGVLLKKTLIGAALR